jgi:hypothetical protein
MLIASFDIGEKNFAYCVAKYAPRRAADPKGPYADDTNNANQLSILKIAHHDVILKKTQTGIESCVRVSSLMMADAQLMACDRFVIEQQMRCNTRAQRLGQHVWSALYTLFPDRLVKFVPSHMKTQHFIGKNQLKDKERKTWSVVKVTQEGVMGDGDRHREIIEEIEGMKKKDDVCDTILQIIAYVGRDVRQKDGGSAKPKKPTKSAVGRGGRGAATHAATRGHEQDESESVQHEGGAETESAQEV